MTHEDIPGWFDFAPLYDAAVERAPDRAVFVEVGCFVGKSTSYLARRIKDSGKKITLWAIDPGTGSVDKGDGFWDGILAEHGGNTTHALLKNLRECGVLDAVNVLPITSTSAANAVPGPIDFVFIDGDHHPDAVLADLKAWFPRVKAGGVIAGHDYDCHWPDVVRTVNEFFGREVPDPICPHCWSTVRE